MSTVDYSSLDSIAATAGDYSSSDSSDGSSDDSTLAVINDIFNTAGANAATLIPAIQGPQALAPNTSYVIGGKVVTTAAATANPLAGMSSSTWLILLAVALVAYLALRKKG